MKQKLQLEKNKPKEVKQMKKIDKRKVYAFIGRAVVYSSLYIATVAFSVWGFLQGMTY